MTKKITLLGSTGSIGRQTLNVVRHLGERVTVKGIAAKGNNLDLLEAQALEFNPEIIAVFDEEGAKELKKRRPSFNVVSGMEGLCEVASYENSDLSVMGMVGTQGILPTCKAILAGKDIALANKEIIVSAGEYVTSLAREKQVTLIPLDSEHSAIFQCLLGERKEDIRRLILTASGGPFLHFDEEQLKSVSMRDALLHPTWTMGEKVSIDCSTLMNKGFEVIEAKWLFDLPIEQLDVVIHPQSIVHSFVEFVDGVLKAQLAAPNMEIPIQYGLTYPERIERGEKPFDFREYSRLEFFQPNRSKFRCLDLAFQALEEGGTKGCVLNAANEVLVERFCAGELPWLGISEKLEEILNKHNAIKDLSVETILEVDREARLEALSI